jgi:hypothetical protein
VIASKGGYVTLEYGQRRPSERGRPVELRDGQEAGEVDFALPRGGVITGQVIDETGAPLAGAVVQALRQRWDAGQRQAGDSAATDVTDDRGQFRLFGLPSGTFLLSATPSEAATPDMMRIARASSIDSAATFYPNTLIASLAQPLSMAAGSRIGGLVLQVLPRQPLTISGTVRTSDGTPPSKATLSIGQLGTKGWSGRSSPLAADGSFSVSGLSPGEYSVTARTTQPPIHLASQHVVLNSADAALDLTLGPGFDLKGRIAFETTAARAGLNPSAVRVVMEGLDAMPQLFGDRATISDDWTFSATGLAGRYMFRLTLPEGWAVKRVHHGITDYTDAPLEIRVDVEGVELLLTQDLTTVTGRVTDDRGRTVTDALVVVLADDPERWGARSRFVQTARPDQNGLFTVRALPAARYVAVAVDYLEAGEETNPDMLAQLRQMGERFTLADGESRNLTLEVTSAP